MGIVDVPQVQVVEKIVEVPEFQTVAGEQTAVSMGTAPVRQVAPAEIVEVTEIGAPLPAESAPAIVVQAPAIAPAPAVTTIQAAPTATVALPAATATVQYAAPAAAVTYAAPTAAVSTMTAMPTTAHAPAVTTLTAAPTTAYAVPTTTVPVGSAT